MKRIIFLLVGLLLISCGGIETNSTTDDVQITEKFLKENKIVKSGDTYFYEGDIAFSEEDLKRYIKASMHSKNRGVLYYSVFWGGLRLWNLERRLDLSYCFKTDMSLSNLSDAMVKQAFREAADVWMGAANIRIYENVNGGYLNVRKSYDIGRISAAAWATYPYSSDQEIVLNSASVATCSYNSIRSIFIHELGHTLGLRHEHQRSESSNTYGQGYLNPLNSFNVGPYDPDSIMHYNNGSDRLSAGDTNTIRYAYTRIGIINQVLSGDINGDGKTDQIIIADGNAVQTLVSQSSGGHKLVKYYPSQDYRTVGRGHWLTGDFNADGKTDLIHIVTVDEKNYIHPWYSNGDGTYTVHRYTPSASYDNSSGEWRVGDFDGDGDTDLIHLVNGNYVHVHFSQRNGQFQVTAPFYPSGVSGGYQIIGTGKWLTGDFNADGKTDLVHIVTVGTKDYMHPWYSNGNGTFAVHRYVPSPGYDNSSGDWAAGDFDGDGDTDLVHLTSANYTHVHHSLRNGQFQVTAPFNPPAGYVLNGTGKWLTGDFNGDGKTDLIHIVTANGGNYVHPWLSIGSAAGDFSIMRYEPSATYNNSLGFWSVGKVNTDANADLIHLATDTYFHSWSSIGTGSFSLQQFNY